MHTLFSYRKVLHIVIKNISGQGIRTGDRPLSCGTVRGGWYELSMGRHDSDRNPIWNSIRQSESGHGGSSQFLERGCQSVYCYGGSDSNVGGDYEDCGEFRINRGDGRENETVAEIFFPPHTGESSGTETDRNEYHSQFSGTWMGGNTGWLRSYGKVGGTGG